MDQHTLLLEKMFERLEGMSHDLAIIKVKQEKMEEDFDSLEGDIQELRSEIKQLNEKMHAEINNLNNKITNREMTIAGTLLMSALGFIIWFLQSSITQ
jgi:predicted  nucleic acid-binding Zn-ribbon protein